MRLDSLIVSISSASKFLLGRALRAGLIYLLGLMSFGLAFASPSTTQATPDTSPQQLMERLLKEQTQAKTPVLKMAGMIKQSAQILSLAEGLTEIVRSPLQASVMAHPEWSSAAMGVDYAQASADESRAALRPQITGGVDYGLRAYGANPISGARSTSYSSMTTQIAAKQLLFDGESKLNTWKSAQKKVEAQTARSYIQRSELMYSLLEAAMNKQRYEIQTLWVNSVENQRKETAKKIVLRFELGSGTIYDIARSDMKVNDSRVNLQQIAIQLNNANTILQEFNLPSSFIMPTVAERIEFSELILEEKLREHPLMMEAQAFLESSELEVAAIKSSQSPIVQLEVSRNDRAFTASGGRSADYSTLVTLTHNFYSGGADTARSAQASARLGQARSELESKYKGLKTALLKSVSEANNSFESLALRKKGVDASSASFAATARLFEVSRGSLQDLQRAEDDLYDNVRQLIDNWFDASIAYYRYLHVSNALTTHMFRVDRAINGTYKPGL